MHNLHPDKHSSFHRRLHQRKHIVKSFRAEAHAKRTITERIADFLTVRLGTMVFLVVNACFFTSWITINSGVLPGIQPYDPFPFSFLTLVVSLEAIFLAIIVLISQNRAAKVDDLREEIALQIDTIAEEEITKIIELQLMMLKKQGIDISKDEKIQEMLEPTTPEQIEKILEKQEREKD